MNPMADGGVDMIRVLHVDDEPDFADMATTFLEREDDRFTTEIATSASEGLDRLSTDDFDCIISDYDMPGDNGIEFLRRVREELPDLPFILYTGKGSEEVASDAISAGVTDYLQKERGTEQYTVLANRIINVVESYRSQRRLAVRNRELRRYKHMINSMHEAACVYDDEGRFVIVNEYLANWYNTTGEALEGDDSNLVPLIREQADNGDPYQAILDGERDHYSGEIEAEFPQHGYAVIEYHLTPLLVDGAVEGVVGVARDITDRKEREEELRLMKRAMDQAPMGITISDSTEADNPLIYANGRFGELTGYDSEEIIGRNCRFLQGEDTAVEPVSEMREAIDAEEPVTVELLNYRKDGTEFWNRVTVAPVRGEDESVSNYVGFQRDITDERRRKERRSHQRQSLFKLITDDAVTSGEFDTAARRIAETAAEVVDVPRVNIWLLDDDDGEDETFTCIDHYDRQSDEHTQGMELSPEEYPAYFEALATNQTIGADDARRDARTEQLTEDYLDPNDIGAVLDGTLRAEGEVIGMICHEQTGGPREWTENEIEFANDIADIIHRALRNQQRNERQQQLEQTNALLSILIDTLPVGVLAEDTDRNVLAVNDRMFDLFDLPGSPDEVKGADCEQMAEQVSELFVNPTRFIEGINTVVANREPTDNEELDLQDGRTLERDYRPIELPKGQGHLWLYRDITGRRKREQVVTALHDVADDLTEIESVDEICRRTIEAAENLLDFGFSIVALEEDGFLQPTAVSTEMPLDEYDSMSIHEGIAGETYRTGESFLIGDSTTCELARKDTPWRSGISLAIGEHGNFQAVDEAPFAFDERDLQLAELLISHTTNHLDRVATKQTLERKNERLNEFASIVSHDLRNPLNVATGRLDLAASECDSEHLGDIERSLSRMEELIDGLLALARQGDSISETEPVSLKAISQECWSNVAIGEARLHAESEAIIEADPERLQQLFENLFRNAVDHAGDQVTVTVGDLKTGFFVEDDGPGIDRKVREEVFGTGFTTKEDGTGFGLAIVQEIVHAHGWEIQITDAQEGGARFEITGIDIADS